MLVGVAINFANVIGRYVFGAAVFWAEEVLIILIVWSVFIGAVAITYDNAHIRMDLVSSRFAGVWRTAANGLAWLAFIACGIFVVFQSSEVVTTMAHTGNVSYAAEIPSVVPHAALLTGFVLMVVALFVRTRLYLRGRPD